MAEAEEKAPTLTADDVVALDLLAAERLAETIRKRFDDLIQSQIQTRPQDWLYPSSMGKRCDRQLYHDVMDWQTKRPFPQAVHQFFHRGRHHEDLIRLYILPELGLKISRDQQAWRDKALRISGRIDGYICEDSTGRDVLVEVKSSQSAGLTACRTIDDLKRNRQGREYYAQVQMYLYLFNIGAAVLLLWDIGKWFPVPIAIPLDWEYAGQLVARAERLKRAIETETPPDYIQDVTVCRKCPHFGRACHPPVSMGDGVDIIVNPELEEKLKRAALLEEVGREWGKLVDEIKREVKTAGERVICGAFLIHNKPGETTKYDIPKDVKVQYAKKVPTVTTQWEPIGSDPNMSMDDEVD